jgi:hypothetical protein
MQRTKTSNGHALNGENLDLLEARYGGRFLRHEAPAEKRSRGRPSLGGR